MRWWLILLAWLPFGPAAVHAAPGTASVTVRMTADGAVADYALDRPVAAFAFARADTVREGAFELATPGLKLDKDVVTGPRPFRAFTLRIRPTTEERDARYPVHFRIGGGGVVYAPALLGDPAQWRTRLVFRTARGQVRAPSTGEVDQGFVFVGPRALVSEDEGVTVVADPATPLWLVSRTRADLAAGVGAFTRSLGAKLPRKPVLIVKHVPGPRGYNVGDVTPGAVASLRFHGAAWEREDPVAARQIQSFVLHEVFHFWNGGLASPADGTPTWLHEGGAEYASLVGGLKGGVLTEEDVRGRLSEALGRCRTALELSGDKSLSGMGFLSNQVRYPCGMVLLWSVDMRMRGASGGGRNVLDAWARIIRAALARPDHVYTLPEFYAAAGIESGESFAPVNLLVHNSGPERWQALPGALEALGAEIGQTPSAAGRRFSLIFHLLRQNCREMADDVGMGFYTDAATIKLDSPKGCGVLTGDPVLKTIEGGDPFAMSEATYAAVQRRCAAREPVTIVTADDRTLSAVCAAPLAPAPMDFEVRRWRPDG
jgi:hypothetical protein